MMKFNGVFCVTTFVTLFILLFCTIFCVANHQRTANSDRNSDIEKFILFHGSSDHRLKALTNLLRKRRSASNLKNHYIHQKSTFEILKRSKRDEETVPGENGESQGDDSATPSGEAGIAIGENSTSLLPKSNSDDSTFFVDVNTKEDEDSSSTSGRPNTEDGKESSESSDKSEDIDEFVNTLVKAAEDNADDDEDDEDDEDDGEEEGCDFRFSSITRNINTSGLLPNDYHQLADKMFETNIYQKVEDFNQTMALVDRLMNYMNKLGTNKDLQHTFQYLSSVASDRVFEAKLDSECTADLLMILNSLRQLEYWALKFPDSWGNLIPSGLLTGVASSFGEFDQCLSIKSPLLASGRHIYGRYCHVQLKPPIPDYMKYSPEWDKVWAEHAAYKFMQSKMTDFTKKLVVDNNTPMVKYLVEMFAFAGQRVLNYGICIPNSCSTDQIERLFNSLIYPLVKTPIIIDPELCTDHPEIENKPLNNFQLFSIIILSILIVFTVASTSYHYYLIKDDEDPEDEDEIARQNKINLKATEEVNYLEVKNSSDIQEKVNENCLSNNLSSAHIEENDTKNNAEKAQVPETLAVQTNVPKSYQCKNSEKNLLLSFSLISNFSKLCATDPERNSVLDTLRIFLTFMLFFVQSYFYTAFQYSTLRNLGTQFPCAIVEQTKYFPGHMPGLWFDGFLFVMCVNLMLTKFQKLFSKSDKFNFLIFAFKRWIRISTALFGSILFIYLYPLIGNGPVWYQNEQWLVHPCKQWPTLLSSFLYYSNWNPQLADYHLENHLSICNFSSWILSASTQIYLLLPLILIPLYRCPKMGLTIIGALVVLTPIVVTSPSWALGHSTFMSVQDTQGSSPKDYYRKLSNYQLNTLQYICSACIGVLTGWLIINRPKLPIPGGRRGEKLLWIFTILIPLALFIWNDTFFQLEEKVSDANILTWFVLSKLLWPMCLGYLVYMTHTGRARKIKRILTFRSMQPLAKFTLCIYLVRILLIWHRNTTVRYTHTYYFSTAMQNIFIDFGFSTFYGLILHLLFEAPTLAIMKYFEKRQTSLLADKQLTAGGKKTALEQVETEK